MEDVTGAQAQKFRNPEPRLDTQKKKSFVSIGIRAFKVAEHGFGFNVAQWSASLHGLSSSRIINTNTEYTCFGHQSTLLFTLVAVWHIKQL
jgi:hypothetical protein